jgi:hypothetical protein
MISDEQFERERKHPELIRNCYYCKFCVAYESWWCTNKEIIKLRGTTIPGVVHCPGWKPNKDAINQMAKNAAKATRRLAKNTTKEILTWEYWGIKII